MFPHTRRSSESVLRASLIFTTVKFSLRSLARHASSVLIRSITVSGVISRSSTWLHTEWTVVNVSSSHSSNLRSLSISARATPS